MSKTFFNKKQMDEKVIPVEVSGRHAHLSEDHFNLLFGAGCQLNISKNLSQTGQFAAKEKISLVTSSGKIENITLVGPCRSKTQIEISATDARKLGIKPPIRLSGDLVDSPGGRIIGPEGNINIAEGVIIAARHIHCDPETAVKWRLKEGKTVSLRIDGLRSLIFQNVTVRIHPSFKLAFHIDTDEANAVFGNSNISEAFLI